MSESIFSRRHDYRLADLIARSMADLDESGRQYGGERFLDLFAGDDADFDRSRSLNAAGAGAREPLASVADLVVRAPLANRDALAELDGCLRRGDDFAERSRDVLADPLTALRRRVYAGSLRRALACARSFEVWS
jgi:hypothetical protein